MQTLSDLLHSRTWRELRALHYAHQLPFDNTQTRTESTATLHSLLTDTQLRRVFRKLPDDAVEALVALQAAGGDLPLWEFTRAFGSLPHYRPWRTPPSALPEAQGGNPPHPWRYPESATARLWFLGFIDVLPSGDGLPRRIYAPAEVLALLPPLPRPEPVPVHDPPPRATRRAAPPPQRGRGNHTAEGVLPSLQVGEGNPNLWLGGMGARATVLVDLAIWLGYLLGEDIRPSWGRWLPPRKLHAVNARLRVQDDLAGARSELQSGRLRFLHYLAEVAGLVGVQGGVLKPTVAAWTWLALPPAQAWRELWEAVQADLETREPLWKRYRLPEASARLWRVVGEQVADLPPGARHSVESLAKAVLPYLPGQRRLVAGLPALLAGPLAWSGLIEINEGAFAVTSSVFPTPQEARLLYPHADPTPKSPPRAQGGDLMPGTTRLLPCWRGRLGGGSPAGRAGVGSAAIWITLPAFPQRQALAGLMAWASFDHDGLRIDAAAVRRALGQGVGAGQIIETLAALAGAGVPEQAVALIRAWAAEAEQLTLRRVVVLESPDPARLAAVRSDWRLRPLLAESLSPRHLVVQGERAEELCRRLARRGQHVAGNPNPLGRAETDGALTPELAEHLWLAGRVYQALGDLVPPEVRLPGAALDWLADFLPEGGADALEQAAGAFVDKLKRALDGQPVSAGGVAQDDPDAVRAAVEAAYESGGALTVEYYSPSYGAATVRAIEPVLVYESGGAEYVEAWCQRDEAMRTFRVDRVLRVVANAEAQAGVSVSLSE